MTNYVEPFFGSGAVLMLRPGGAGYIETVNDADGLLANFWRALALDPESAAAYADWPVSEADMHARQLWLLGQRDSLTDRLIGDPDYFDPKAAGWWVWGQCCWIGSGWCSGVGPWITENGVVRRREKRSAEDADDADDADDAGRGIIRQRPHLGDAGVGVNRPNASETAAEKRARLIGYFRTLADRLHRVRSCCGDWSRVCTTAVTTIHGLTGVFLDPPYADTAGRAPSIYATDCLQVAHDVRAWAIENGSNPLMRIVLAGYEGEHTMPPDWRVVEWKAAGGYANLAKTAIRGKENRHRERLWLSPHCVTAAAAPTQKALFAEATTQE